MECNDIQGKMPDYIEGALSQEEKLRVEEHIKTCRHCSESLADLRKTIEHINNLEVVEPPRWLTQKVMTRVREEAEQRKTIWQKLFYPLHIKLPVEAFAAVAVVALTIYVLRSIEPEIKFTQAPQEKVLEKDVKQNEDSLKQPLYDVQSPKTAIIPAPHEEKKAVLPEDKNHAPILKEGEITPAQPEERPSPAKERESVAGYAVTETSPSSLAKQKETGQSAGAAPKEKLKQELFSASSGKAAMARKQTEGITLSIYVHDTEYAKKDIWNIIHQLGGKIVETEYFVDKDILTVSLNLQKIEELHKRLKLIGEVKKKEPATGELEREVEIKIEIIKKQ